MTQATKNLDKIMVLITLITVLFVPPAVVGGTMVTSCCLFATICGHLGVAPRSCPELP